MKNLIFSTGNSQKFTTAKQACDKYLIALTQQDVAVDEIQDEDPQRVAIDKAKKAFQIIKQPLVITDDSWSFAGLKGFPGVYMHSINNWFTPDDFIRLVRPLKNRDTTLTAYLIYIDQNQLKIFTQQTKGTLLKEIKGQSTHSSHTIITMDGDNGLSIAEAYDQASDKSTRVSARIWHDFAEWYSEI